MEKDRMNLLPPPWRTFAILMCVVFIAEAFVMYLIHPIEDKFSYLSILIFDATLLVTLMTRPRSPNTGDRPLSPRRTVLTLSAIVWKSHN